jgi:Zn finger protein HypA/HybF involved in hydrogenase expression
MQLILGSHEFFEADSVKFCFDFLAKGTTAEGARIEVKRADATANCGVPSIVLQLA